MYKKLDGTTIGNSVDLDLVMQMYKLIEYSSNYSETTEGLWFYSKDEGIDFNADIVNHSNFNPSIIRLGFLRVFFLPPSVFIFQEELI